MGGNFSGGFIIIVQCGPCGRKQQQYGHTTLISLLVKQIGFKHFLNKDDALIIVGRRSFQMQAVTWDDDMLEVTDTGKRTDL